MGCGQSKIHLYPRKSKSKANGKKGGHVDSDAETDEDEGHNGDIEKFQNNECNKNEEPEENGNKDTMESDEEAAVSLLRAKNLSLLQSQEISTSQQNFFRMLDKKIEEGPDYDSNSETERALEEARLNALVQHWESASLTASMCSSASRSLQTTPVRQTPAKQLAPSRTLLTTSIPPQLTIGSEFLPHGNTAIQQSINAPVKLMPNKPLVMNSGMLHQMAMLPQLPMDITTETVSGTSKVAALNANSSSALTMLQVASSNLPLQTSQTQQYLLSIPTGSSPRLGRLNQISPKRLVDTRMLINSSSLVQQQMQPSPPNNFIPTQYISIPPNLQTATTSVTSNYMNGGHGPHSGAVTLQLGYYGQTSTAQQSMQQAIPQTQMEQTSQSQNQTLSVATLPTSSAYYGGSMQTVQTAPGEYRFPPVISVQRLAPQVQRQLRETQELIKDSCSQLYATAYGSPLPPPPLRNQTNVTSRSLSTSRRSTLETQFSQELS